MYTLYFNPLLKLWRARSRLYRSQSLQLNTHFAAFFESYKMCIPLHRSNLEKSVKNRHQFCEEIEKI